MTTWTHFNANDYVRVRLTKHGREIHKRHHESLVNCMRPSVRSEFPYCMPEEDEDGWSRWQLWSLMQMYGPHMFMTGELCFEMDIQFETK